MTAFLSIILAFMNILPIPALDGGHVFFLLYEIITGRKPGDKFMERAEYIGFGILILLLVVANLNDVLRFPGITRCRRVAKIKVKKRGWSLIYDTPSFF